MQRAEIQGPYGLRQLRPVPITSLKNGGPQSGVPFYICSPTEVNILHSFGLNGTPYSAAFYFKDTLDTSPSLHLATFDTPTSYTARSLDVPPSDARAENPAESGLLC